MKIKAYRLYDHAVAFQPSPDGRDWDEENEMPVEDPSLGTINSHRWDFLCPYAIEATWNGGPDAADIEIRTEGIPADTPSFVQSIFGGGRLTFHTGYQIKTEGEQTVWVRGSINRPKDGLYPLESTVDAATLPCTMTVNWTFTRPNQTVRFAAGEPFCTILPYPKQYAQNVETEIVTLGDDLAALDEEYETLAVDPAIHNIFQKLGANGSQANSASSIVAVNGSSPENQPNVSWATQLNALPPVSCICPTYGRVALLEEAIYSFLQQDYPGAKELIVLNDYAGQTLEFDHPEVRIVNLPKRFHSVGEKYKAAAALATHDLVFVWHDDDIYLPHRLSYSVAHHDAQKGFFKADRAWFWNNGQLSGPDQNVFHGGSCWTRDLFVDVHGYPHVGNTYDTEFEELCRCKRADLTLAHPVKAADVYYIYRWNGTNSYHFSAISENGHAYEDVATYVQNQAARGQISSGRIQLDPHWQHDYVAQVEAFLQEGEVKEHTTNHWDEIPYPPPFYTIEPPDPMAADDAERLFHGTYPAKISVILPASNESVLLKRTVEQFVATLPDNCEVIVVDNGSTDGSADFLVDSPIEGVNLIQTPDPLGVAGARNCGLEIAQGEFVVFADAHIDLPERWWQPIIALLNQPKVGVVGPGIGVMGKPDSPIAYGQRIAEANLRVEWLPWVQKEPYPVPTLGGGFMAMHHDTLKQAGAFDVGMPQWGSEDLEICVRYWLLGYEVWMVPSVNVLHYFRSSNPYKVEWGAITHNLLRVALLHFNQERLARVIAALKGESKFDHALAVAVESDVWQQRAEFAAHRVRDDDWLFAEFSVSCSV